MGGAVGCAGNLHRKALGWLLPGAKMKLLTNLGVFFDEHVIKNVIFVYILKRLLFMFIILRVLHVLIPQDH